MELYKFDTSTGLSRQQIGVIKFCIKKEISKYLPFLPEHIETKLFFEGRDAWTFGWRLLMQDSFDPKGTIAIDVDVKLKKEFHQYNDSTHYAFACKVKLMKDIYRPKIIVTKTK